VPPKFGAHMGGGASQFGIDEECVPDVLAALAAWPAVRVDGFHLYSGSNCLNVDSLGRHFALTIDVFDRLATFAPVRPRLLVIGAGFGVAYHPGDAPLSLGDVAARLGPILETGARRERLAGARWVMEMGRYLVAEPGVLLTSVVRVKHSRGTNIAVLDAGFNNHLAAAGLMGSLLRRNWPVMALTARGALTEYTLVGPLCTSIDTLGTRIQLPMLREGDILAIGASGAYGFSASPSRFISHPEPREVILLDEMHACDASETAQTAGRC
jgi:diaminopimelate decarboxylase